MKLKMFLSVATLACAAHGAEVEVSPVPTASPAAEKSLHSWVVSEKKSPIDDSQTVTFALIGVSENQSHESPLLIIVYREHKWDAIIGIGEYLGYAAPKVVLRWDEEKAVTESWDPAIDHAAAFAPAAKKFVLRALKGDRLTVRLFPKFVGEHTTVFDLRGLSVELDKYPDLKKSLGF